MTKTFPAYTPEGELVDVTVRRATQRPGLQQTEREDFCAYFGMIVASCAGSCIMAAVQEVP